MAEAPLLHFRFVLAGGDVLERRVMFEDKAVLVGFLEKLMTDPRPAWLKPRMVEMQGETLFLSADVEADAEEDARVWLGVG